MKFYLKQHVVLVVIFVFFLLSFSGCGKTDKEVPEGESNNLSIVTTIFPQYDFAKQISGGKADVAMLLKPGAESHSYEPTPQDIKTIQNADLFIYVGGENDVWVEDILDSMKEKKPKTLKLLDCVSTVEEEIVEGMEHEHEDAHDTDVNESEEGEHDHEAELEESDHEHEGEVDEHVWTSPKNVIKIAEKITEAMSEADSENAAFYSENSAEYTKQLETLDAEFREIVKNSKRKTILFGDRFPFRYLAEEYGLEYHAAFSGCATDTEASAATVAFLIDKVKEEKLPVVFTIEFSNGKIADSICTATGAKKLMLHSCHNLSKEEIENGESYLSLMAKNAENLKEALN